MDGIGWAAGAMSAARARLDAAAENLANGSKDGFRRTAVRGFLTERGVVTRRVRDDSPGPLRRTGAPYDFAIDGAGVFRVRAADGSLQTTRCGAFRRDRFERLVDQQGRALLGARGAIVVPDGAVIGSDGGIVLRGKRINAIPLPAGSSLRTGYVEASNVDAIGEMIDVLGAQRSFETAQKVLSAIDQTRERAATQVGVLK